VVGKQVLTAPVAEYDLTGRKLRARASAKDYAFTLQVIRGSEDVASKQEGEEEVVVTLRFLNEAELREWHRFVASPQAATPL
jgi:hypothetical protein